MGMSLVYNVPDVDVCARYAPILASGKDRPILLALHLIAASPSFCRRWVKQVLANIEIPAALQVHFARPLAPSRMMAWRWEETGLT